jgi:hypothetical protein
LEFIRKVDSATDLAHTIRFHSLTIDFKISYEFLLAFFVYMRHTLMELEKSGFPIGDFEIWVYYFDREI